MNENENKKENDILEESIESVKADSKNVTPSAEISKQTEQQNNSQDELLKIIMELKSEVSSLKRKQEDENQDEDITDEDSPEDDGSDVDEDTFESDISAPPKENLEKTLNTNTTPKDSKLRKLSKGCLIVVLVIISSILLSVILSLLVPFDATNNDRVEADTPKADTTNIKILPQPVGGTSSVILCYRENKWTLFSFCIFIFAIKIFISNNRRNTSIKYGIISIIILTPIFVQWWKGYENYDQEFEYGIACAFFISFATFAIGPILYWFFGKLTECPKCGTPYAFEEINREYDHALAPKWAKTGSQLRKDWAGNNYQVQTVYYRITLRCKNCGSKKEKMKKVEEKI